jgi:hypothetical protein
LEGKGKGLNLLPLVYPCTSLIGIEVAPNFRELFVCDAVGRLCLQIVNHIEVSVARVRNVTRASDLEIPVSDAIFLRFR